jgi:formate-dependent nitrite reductase cytochrome c552 subunit
MVKKIVLCAAVLAMVCGFSAISMAGEGSETITFDTAKKGKTTVTFQHWTHQGRMECAECHHTKNADGTKGPYVAGQEAKCATCHELGSMKDNIHVNCKGCHKDGGKGPTSCGDCHKK